MPSSANHNHILMRPIPVHYAGWRSDLLTLQQNGWRVSAEQDTSRMMMRFMIHHPRFQLEGVSRYISYREYIDPQYDIRYSDYGRDAVEIVICHQYRVDDRQADLLEAVMEPIDATPRMIRVDHMRSISELKIFEPLRHRGQEIYLSEASMADILNVALSKQEPQQAEIRQRMLRDQRVKEMRMESEVKAELRLIA